MFQILLGTAGVAAVNWLVANQDLIATILGFYLLIYAAGRLQLRRVRFKTEALVLETAQKLAADNKPFTPNKLYKKVYPVWSESLKHWALYVMDTMDIWLVPPTAKSLEKRAPFSPKSIAELLRKHGLSGTNLDSEPKQMEG